MPSKLETALDSLADHGITWSKERRSTIFLSRNGVKIAVMAVGVNDIEYHLSITSVEGSSNYTVKKHAYTIQFSTTARDPRAFDRMLEDILYIADAGEALDRTLAQASEQETRCLAAMKKMEADYHVFAKAMSR